MSKDKSKTPRLNKEDINLWKIITRDVKRLTGRDYIDPEKAQHKPAAQPKKTAATGARPSAPIKNAAPSGLQKNMDRRTEDRLRKGKIKPEARLDLHGMTQTQAHAQLNSFIQHAWKTKKRCVLIITGKGEPRLSPENRANEDAADQHWTDSKPGVLRRRTPDWLDAPILHPYVLKYVTAQPKDGGAGALYVYLRKNKET